MYGNGAIEPDTQTRQVTVHRLVLLGLLAPIIALGVVFWLFLPGGIASLTYSPGEFSRAAQLSPSTWQNRSVSIRGYLISNCGNGRGDPAPSGSGGCGQWLLADRPIRGAESIQQTIANGALRVLPQYESGWHAILRRIIPGLAAPFPSGIRAGERVTVTGHLQTTHLQDGVPTFVPKDL